jgi:hypothetical protein
MNIEMTMLEVKLPNDDAFLQIKETLERIGIANFRKKTLYQSCHILQKKGKYYIVSFKEMFALDGKPTNITEEDLVRRNNIALLLQDWELLEVVNDDLQTEVNGFRPKMFVLKYSEKPEWTLISKYTIGAN